MKKAAKISIAILLIFTVLLGLNACGAKEDPQTTSSEPEVSSQPAESQPEQKPTGDGSFNPLTGLSDNWSKDIAGQFTGLMVANNAIARPQYGITKADWIVESETEGGITRLMLIFADSTLVPEEVCPVRSARSHFVKIANSMHLNYVHAGGSVKGVAQLKISTQLTDINALAYDGTTFWRNEDLKKNKGLEYSLMASGERLTKHIKKLKGEKLAATPYTPAYEFGEITEGTDAKVVQAQLTGAQIVHFIYDEATGKYKKSNGSIGSNRPHVDAKGEQIAADNIIFIYDELYKETYDDGTEIGTISFHLQKGAGKAVTKGTAQEIQWEMTANGFRFTDSKGAPLTLSKGQTYLCLMNKFYASTVKTGATEDDIKK